MRIQRWRFDVAGLEHVPNRGGCVIAANHTSFWDFFAVAQFPYLRLGRPVRILAKESLFRVPLFGQLMTRTGCMPVERGNGGNARVHAVTSLRSGEVVLILPEETISRSFDLLPFKRGAVRVAQAAGVPLVPVVSWGSHRFFTTGRRARWSYRLPVSVRFGEPLYVLPADDVAVVTKELRTRMQAMLDEIMATYPDGAPPGAWWVPHRLGGGAPRHDAVERDHKTTKARWRRRGN
ncbi:MAG: 1-acyl-sn-glycerol-3-phosphate acyltransferase [bacterium]|nr:1-acyl-sn-glycerol-3-phosphate acyltransferase [bacterium]